MTWTVDSLQSGTNGYRSSSSADWFDRGDSSGPGSGPVRPPPRRHRSSSYLAGSSSHYSNGHGGYRNPASSSFGRGGSALGGRHLQQARSASTHLAPSPSSRDKTFSSSSPVRRYTVQEGTGGRLVRRRKTLGEYDVENR